MIQPYSDNEFFSGAQARVYFGDILVDDIASIEWRGSSTKRPVYGYASEQFDAVSKGQYIVQGAFMIPFKEVGYLHAVMKAGKSDNDNHRLQALLASIRGKKNSEGQPFYSSVNGRNIDPRQNPRTSVTTIIKDDDDGTPVTAFVSGTLTADQVLAQAAGDPNAFKQLTDQFEDAIWNRNLSNDNKLPRPDEFDIEPGPNGRRFVRDGFNILVSFGNIDNPNAPSTIKTIVDVHLISDERIVDTTGQPIYERYSFFARGADETVASVSSGIRATSRSAAGGSNQVTDNISGKDETIQPYDLAFADLKPKYPVFNNPIDETKNIQNPISLKKYLDVISVPPTPDIGNVTFNSNDIRIDKSTEWKLFNKLFPQIDWFDFSTYINRCNIIGKAEIRGLTFYKLVDITDYSNKQWILFVNQLKAVS